MKSRHTTVGTGPGPQPASGGLPKVITLEEATRLANMSAESLWQDIRAGKFSFTLVSGRSDTGVLLDTDDLIRAGILQDEPARPTPAQLPVRPPSVPILPPVARTPNG